MAKRTWHARRDSRKIHRWGAILVALPFLIVLCSGLVLQVKKEFKWIQPATATGSMPGASASFDDILAAAKAIPELKTSRWEHIDRLDVRPEDGIIKIRANNGWEAQIDAHTTAVLRVAPRRSDLIESIHDGSWFHDNAKLWIFLPVAIVVLILWITGLYLIFVPYLARYQNRKKRTRRRKRLQKMN